MKTFVIVVIAFVVLLGASFTDTHALIPPIQVRDNINEVVKLLPTSTPIPTPTTAIQIKLPLGRTAGSITVVPTTTPTSLPTQTTTRTETQVTSTVTLIVSPSVLPSEASKSALSENEVAEQPPVESNVNKLSLKEIIGIGLVIFLILVIVFQSRKGNKEEIS